MRGGGNDPQSTSAPWCSGHNSSSSASAPLFLAAPRLASTWHKDSSTLLVLPCPRNPRGVRLRAESSTGLKPWDGLICQEQFPLHCFVLPIIFFFSFILLFSSLSTSLVSFIFHFISGIWRFYCLSFKLGSGFILIVPFYAAFLCIFKRRRACLL